MRTINKYLLQDFLVIFGITLLIITFVMSLGVVIRAIDFAARGLSGSLITKIFLLNLPYMLTFSLPMSVLTATLLLFGRLSFDGELTAMKASGLSMWQIISPVVLMSIACSVVCVFITTYVGPTCKGLVRGVLAELGTEDPVNLLESGRFVRDFPGVMVYVGSRDENKLEDVVVYEMGEDGPVRNVRATTGEVRIDADARAMYVDLYDVRIDQMEKDKVTGVAKSHYLNAQHYPVKLEFGDAKKKSTRQRVSDMTFGTLIDTINNVRVVYPELKEQDYIRQRMSLVVEANKRLALSLSCFAFCLVAIPLGMKSKRKESSVGIGISLALVFVFYLFIILANSLLNYPSYRPDLIVWIPVVLGEIAGFVMIQRTN